MTTVLITAIAGDIAQSVAVIIRETFPDWRLVGADVHDRHGGQLFVDVLARAPYASDPGYLPWLRAVVALERVDLCVPMSEAELQFLSGLGATEVAGARLVMASRTAVTIGSDKLETARFIQSIGCPAPWTVPSEQFDAATHLPCIFKPRRSAGSKSVFVCRTAAEVLFYRDRNPPAVIQELLLPPDREVTCALYRHANGPTIVLQLLRTLVGGFTGWARVIDEDEVTEQCARLADALDLNGSINVQLRLTSDGPRIFEINPRFSSTVLMRHRMGFQDVVWSLRHAMGEAAAVYRPAVGTTAVRVQGAVVLGRDAIDRDA